MKQTVIYKKNDRFSLQADFYETNREHAPVIIYIHGGGLIWGTREDITKDMIEFYTSNGFSLFSIDYRLAPESKLPDILEDVQDALRWIEAEGPKYFSIDPNKIVIVGGSAGGFLALCSGTFKHKPRAIVSFYGYGDISASWATNPSPYYLQKDMVPNEIAEMLQSNQVITEGTIEQRFLIYLHARQHGVWVQKLTALDPIKNKDQLLTLCPIHHITKDYPPTLFLHGTKDTDVPYEQSVFMRAALLKKDVKTKFITIPNGEHVFEKDFHLPIVQNALKQMIEFLQEHVQE
ncbi:alpha/beta hydrolase [Bacillus sp. AFS002410]|uniref:alpha/beta hydrolase n=1 Tax=Bacillus sp. AFS002410 TaxID=2033481 RepID=UPI000BF099EA|nr:alpha/beta hydrolase [Bacillus sp. AFS002410]PEJ57083.1 alpha/beta hydrolase [Bacillus sp. AFS002410]